MSHGDGHINNPIAHDAHELQTNFLLNWLDEARQINHRYNMRAK